MSLAKLQKDYETVKFGLMNKEAELNVVAREKGNDNI
jgi:hypothetical protein